MRSNSLRKSVTFLTFQGDATGVAVLSVVSPNSKERDNESLGRVGREDVRGEKEASGQDWISASAILAQHFAAWVTPLVNDLCRGAAHSAAVVAVCHRQHLHLKHLRGHAPPEAEDRFGQASFRWRKEKINLPSIHCVMPLDFMYLPAFSIKNKTNLNKKSPSWESIVRQTFSDVGWPTNLGKVWFWCLFNRKVWRSNLPFRTTFLTFYFGWGLGVIFDEVIRLHRFFQNIH